VLALLYNALRNSAAHVGDVVAILGIGELGHLGIQFASKMGFKTIALGRGKGKEEMARKLGAIHYIDSQSQNPAEELVKFASDGDGKTAGGKVIEGAKVILATVPSAKAMGAVLGGLSVNGKLIIVGASDEMIQMPPSLFISARRSIMGWASGTSIDSQDTLSFSILSGVRSMNEVFPLERAAEAYDSMMSGKVRFRAVLTTTKN
jgi:D-arabinose 1-dehydrogenase-like Zn-dependent alcohol dehydrogenase